MHPLHQLESTETALIASLRAATAKLDTIATGTLDDALAAFQAAAVQAQARLARAANIVHEDATDLLTSLLLFVGELTPPVVVAPAPVVAIETQPVIPRYVLTAEEMAEFDHDQATGADAPVVHNRIEAAFNAPHTPGEPVAVTLPFEAQTLSFAGAEPSANGKAKPKKRR